MEKSINAILGVRHSTAVWTTTCQLPLAETSRSRQHGVTGLLRVQ